MSDVTCLSFGPFHARSLGAALCALLIITADHAVAQANSAPSADVGAGVVSFVDDGPANEGMVSAGFRWYLSPRVSLGPEVVYISGEAHSHVIATGNVTVDLVTTPTRAMPFVVIGGGLYQTRERFAVGRFTSNEGAFTAGGGVRVPFGDRVSLGVDVRVGWELHLRVNGLLSVKIGS